MKFNDNPWLDLLLSGVTYAAVAWAVFFVVRFLFVVPYQMWRGASTDADALRRQIQGAGVELSQLRNEGVALRNDIRGPIADEETWKEHEAKIIEWDQRVFAAIQKRDASLANWYQILDVVPPPRVHPIYDKQNPEPWLNERVRVYTWQDLRIVRLNLLIEPK